MLLNSLISDTHPDDEMICIFRRQNEVLFRSDFVSLLETTARMGHLKKSRNVSPENVEVTFTSGSEPRILFYSIGMEMGVARRRTRGIRKAPDEIDVFD
jgi:hypothetical protein